MHTMRFENILLPVLAAITAMAPVGGKAATPQVYQQPSPEVLAVLDAKGLPGHMLSPDQHTLAMVELRRYRQVAELARPILRLAGKRIDAAANGPQLTAVIESIRLRELTQPGATVRTVQLPAGGSFHQLRWSPDSKHFLLHRRTPQATELWVGETDSAKIRPIKGVRLNHVLEDSVAWIGSDEIVALTVPDERRAAPQFEAPFGPTIQESMGRNSPERTLQDLLKNSQDEALFTHYATSSLRRISLRTGSSRQIGESGFFSSVHVLGAQGLLLTERLTPPFSYQVTWDDFARRVELRDISGKVVRDLGTITLKESVPVEGVITGPRNYWASPYADAAVYWVDALDSGDPRNKVPHRDRLMRLDPPYQGEGKEVHRTAGRLAGLSFVEGGNRAIVTDVDRDRLWLTTDLLTLDGAAKPLRVQDRSMRDRYKDAGQPLQRILSNGRSVARLDGNNLMLVGAGASAAGDRPFLDQMSLSDAKTTRLFQSSSTHFERPLAVLTDNRIVTSRETFSEPPNLMLRSGPDFAQMQALTQHADPTPQLRAIQRELVKFKRADGVEMSFWMYLPPDYKVGERRPTFVWAYPLEFTDASTAGQVSGSASRFNTFGGSSPLMLLLDGYVVLMDATMPVVGDPKVVNDSFVEQITANAKAIIDKADELGVSDPKNMVVGGHSYGAFMTANLLAHTDLFKAGIARSGAYNRSLTPFGFQSERRTYWEAQEVYLRLSPFNYAHQLKEPLLLIHGENDDNPGTFPLQTQRLYQALAGTGGNVRYVSLPFESHGYSARESIGHTLREMSDWMKRQTRDPRAAPSVEKSQ
ncbi:MAG: prolyl oligopeptidase [Burkholderiales bacterium PBB4]|nr:MAG: prolyl oligopeptidase [Burkholderiales bacterium PBB4]